MDKLVGFARKKRLGDLLVDAGVISQDQLVKALQVQKTEKQGERLGVVLIDLGFTDGRTDRIFSPFYRRFSHPLLHLSVFNRQERSVHKCRPTGIFSRITIRYGSIHH